MGLVSSLIALAASPAFAAGHAAVSGYALADDGATLVVMHDVNGLGDVMTYSLASPLKAIAWRAVTGELLGFSDGMIATIDPMSGKMTDLGASFAEDAMIGDDKMVAFDFNNKIDAVRASHHRETILSISPMASVTMMSGPVPCADSPISPMLTVIPWQAQNR